MAGCNVSEDSVLYACAACGHQWGRMGDAEPPAAVDQAVISMTSSTRPALPDVTPDPGIGAMTAGGPRRAGASAANILYVMKVVDMANGLPVRSAKIGLAPTGAGKRITPPYKTDWPFKVELESAWSFANAQMNAANAHKAIRALLQPLRLRREWFRDDDHDLVERVAKFVEPLGATAVGDDTPEYAAMNARRRAVRDALAGVFEPLRPRLQSLGIVWDYLQWRVGLSTRRGRLVVEVKPNRYPYLTIRLFHEPELTVEDANAVSTIEWTGRGSPPCMRAVKVTADQLMEFITVTAKTG